ncbi:hypothetical protein Tco_1331970 [Tanacetum coccineum]
MVMETSRAEYIANDKFKHQLGRRESSTSKAEPSSSGDKQLWKQKEERIKKVTDVLAHKLSGYIDLISLCLMMNLASTRKYPMLSRQFFRRSRKDS